MEIITFDFNSSLESLEVFKQQANNAFAEISASAASILIVMNESSAAFWIGLNEGFTAAYLSISESSAAFWLGLNEGFASTYLSISESSAAFWLGLNEDVYKRQI